MSFHSLDEEMEEMIISLGDINDDNSSTEHMSSDYDLLSDEGIFVIDTLKKQHSIEMEVSNVLISLFYFVICFILNFVTSMFYF